MTDITIRAELGEYLTTKEMYPEEKKDRMIHPFVDGKVPEKVDEEVQVVFEIGDRDIEELKVGLKFSLGYSPVFVKAAGENPSEIQDILNHGSSRVYIDNEGILHFSFGEILSGKSAAEARSNLIDVLIRGILKGAKAEFKRRTYLKPQKRYHSNQLFALGYFTSYEKYTRDKAEPLSMRYGFLKKYYNQLVMEL